MTKQIHSISTRARADHGEVTIETVILVPAVIFVVLLVVQAAVVLHGINVAHHIAGQGAMTAARHGSSLEQAIVSISTSAETLGARLAGPPLVSTSQGDVTVRVWVVLPQAIPLFAEQVSREVTVPRERYVPYGDR